MKPPVKTASKSDVGHGRTLHHSPARRLPTRLLHPDGLTRPEYHVNSSMMNSIIMNSNVISREPSRGKGFCAAESTCNRI